MENLWIRNFRIINLTMNRKIEKIYIKCPQWILFLTKSNMDINKLELRGMEYHMFHVHDLDFFIKNNTLVYNNRRLLHLKICDVSIKRENEKWFIINETTKPNCVWRMAIMFCPRMENSIIKTR